MQTTSRDDQIVKFREAGLTLSQIGHIFGISRERVRQILKIVRYVNRRVEETLVMQTTSSDDEIVKFREAGLTYAQIGHILGISKERVRQILKLKPPAHKPDLQSKVILTVTGAAQLLGVHPNTVRRWSEKGILKSYRIGSRRDRRFRREDVDDVLGEPEIEQ